jgi:peptidoglycan hydrolase CwlO-like protein
VHGLTKAFVVLAAILSIVLSVMVIGYAVNADRIATDYSNAVNAKSLAEASNSSGRANFQSQVDALNTQITQLNADKQQSEVARKGLEAERATLDAARAKAEQERNTVQAKIAELSETVKTMQTLIASYKEEVTGLRRNELSNKQARLEMEDRISDLESQRDVLSQNFRAVQEQLAEARMAAANAGSASAGATSATDPNRVVVWNGPQITGRIESIERDNATGKTIARISLGSNNGVLKNMQFHVVRDGSFVNNLKIIQPDLKESVAEVSFAAPYGNEIRVGDQVLTRFR